MYHPQILHNLKVSARVLLEGHDQFVAEAADAPKDVAEQMLDRANRLKSMAEGYKRLLRHAQVVNAHEPPPAPAPASTTPDPVTPAAPAAAELAEVSA